MALGDRIAVMFDGSIHQVGTPDQIYRAPETLAAAALFGALGGCSLPGVVEQVAASHHVVRLVGAKDQAVRISPNRSTYAGQSVMLDFRAEDVALAEPDAGAAADADADLRLEVLTVHHRGEVATVTARVPGTGRELSASYHGAYSWRAHQSARAVVSRCNLYDAGAERLILSSADPRFVTAAAQS